MNLHDLKSAPGARHRRKRVGRGMRSGMGKTAGRGHKGQYARKGHKHKAGFEGGQMRLIRRLPKRGFKNPTREGFVPVNVGDLAVFPEGTAVAREQLAAQGLIKSRDRRIKILGTGELPHKLAVTAAAFSESAKRKIEAAGGTCTVG